jgi:predicted nuclease of predicted toxin-antitoxin system
MKVLLDECTPRLLKRLLSGFEVLTVQDLGWTGITNGALLAQAEGKFDIFITTDKNLRYQQNLMGKQLSIIQLPTNQVPVVELLAPSVQEVLARIKPGEFLEIPLPESDPEL